MSEETSVTMKLCNTLYNEFKETYNLGLHELCPSCKNIGAFHNRSEPIISTTSVSSSTITSSTSVTNSFIKIQKLLPKFM
jgi:hypothetical protein